VLAHATHTHTHRHTDTHTHTYIPTGVERRDVNQDRGRGVVLDDDGDGQVGCSQSAETTVGDQRGRG